MSENENHIYIAIDLKSFYASVECRERDLDPLTTNLVVAGSRADGEDDLPGGFTFFKSIWDSGTSEAF